MSTRREFMAGTVAASSALLLEKPLNAASMVATEPQLFVSAISGDPVRFARGVFGPNAPEIVGGLTSYADFLVLTGCAAEAGYRVLSERTEGALIRWKVARLR
jgi:hypothetical protein